jgi:hypothetical protein
MKTVNINNIDDIIDAKMEIDALTGTHTTLNEFIERYICLENSAFVYWKRNTQAVVPYSIFNFKNNSFLFIAADDIDEQQHIEHAISTRNMNDIKKIPDTALLEKMSDENMPTFEAFIINNEYYQ